MACTTHRWRNDPDAGIWDECADCGTVRRRDRVREAERARDAAIEAVEHHATIDERTAVADAIRVAAMRRAPSQPWTSDLVLDILDEAGVELAEPRLLGPAMRRAEKDGLIEPVVCPTCRRIETAMSERPSRHRGPQRLWRRTTQ